MSRIEEIKAAAAKLDPEEQFELFRWWVGSKAFKIRQLAALKRDIAAGIEDLDSGRYQTYDASRSKRLAGEVGRSGRKRLKDIRKTNQA